MAGLIPRAFIDDLLARLDIVEVVGSRVPLKKKGGSHMACCPFHEEKTPSFSVSQSKQFYHCFGCGASGSAIGFVMEYDRLGFVETIELLAGELGLTVPREGGEQRPREDHSALYDVLARCTTWYQQQLRETPAAVEYLKRRGLDGETARRFGLGYAPGGWDTLTGQRLPERELDRAGMLSHGDGNRRYDRFRERVMFPIRDRRGRTVAFGGRVMGDGEPKYLNSPETPLFHKGQQLYGLFELLQAVRKPERIIVVEGYMDVVALAQAGVPNAVATLGTATTTAHVQQLFRTAHELVFCFDGDRAGRAAAWRALENSLGAMRDGFEVRFLLLPDGEDPDSLVRAQGAAGFERALEGAAPLSTFLFDQLTAGRDLASIGDRAAIGEAARPLIAKLPDGLYRELLAKQLSALVGATVTLPAAKAARPKRPPRRSESERLTPMRAALAMMLQYPHLLGAIDPEAIECPPEDRAAPIFYKLVALISADPDAHTASLLEQFRDERWFGALAALAAHRLPDGEEFDEPTARQLLDDSLARLRREAARLAAAEMLQGRSSSTLDDVERKRYLSLLARSRGE